MVLMLFEAKSNQPPTLIISGQARLLGKLKFSQDCPSWVFYNHILTWKNNYSSNRSIPDMREVESSSKNLVLPFFRERISIYVRYTSPMGKLKVF